MRRIHVAVLLVLAAAVTVGLGVLLLHVEGIAILAHGSAVAIGVAVAVILALGGFFVGAMYGARSAEDTPERSVVRRLSEALSLERKLRVEASRERYRLRQTVNALEGQLRSMNARPLPPAELAETPLTDEDLTSSAELEELATTCERLRRELVQRKERMADLEAELSVAQAEADDLRSRGDGSPRISAVAFRGESLTTVLDDLVGQSGIHVALVADDQGLVVDAAGEVLEPDALAAVSSVVAELSPRVNDLLPLGEIVTVGLGDATGRMLEVRYFTLLGSRCALAVVRDEGVSSAEIVRRATDAIAERLSQ